MTPNVGGYFVEKFVATMYHYLQFAYYKCEPPVGVGVGWERRALQWAHHRVRGAIPRIQAPGRVLGVGVRVGQVRGLRERTEGSLRVND